jgi:hypothetical protein
LTYVNDGATTSSITTGAGSLTATTPNSVGEGLVWRVQTTGTYFVRVRTGAIQPNTFATPVAPTGDYLLSISLANNNLGNGACCSNSGACAVVSGVTCNSPSLFQGVGTACAAGACPVATLACCSVSTGACTFSNAASCFAGSTHIGAVCSPSPCPVNGACCASSGVCSLTTAAGCTAAAIFQGQLLPEPRRGLLQQQHRRLHLPERRGLRHRQHQLRRRLCSHAMRRHCRLLLSPGRLRANLRRGLPLRHDHRPRNNVRD